MRFSGNLSLREQPYHFLRHTNSSSSKDEIEPVVPGQKPNNDRPPLREYFNTKETAQDSNKSSSPYSEVHALAQSMCVDIYA